MDCSLPGSSIHGILQARILEWVAISFSRGSPGIKPGSPALEADALTSETPGKPLRETKIAAPSLPFRMVSLHIITFNSQLPVKKFNTHISGGFGFFVLSCFSVSWSFPDFFFFFWRNELYYLKYENFQDKDIFILYLLLKAYFNKLLRFTSSKKKKKICLPVL